MISKTSQIESTGVLGKAYAGVSVLMLPTAIGAWLSATALAPIFHAHRLAAGMSELVIALALLASVFAFRRRSLGFFLAQPFALVMGLAVGSLVEHVLNASSHGADLVILAAVGTAALFGSLSAFAVATGKDFSGLGGILFASLGALLIASFAVAVFAIPASQAVVAGLGIALFSGYVLYDTSEIVNGYEGNWLIASVCLYLDILNLFVDILRLLSFLSDFE